jgi:tRNA1(Val) A37 N6-methylase TrmN6
MKAIKNKMPFVDYLQTNDLEPWDLGAIKLACSLFLADIPLWDENFNLVDNPEFRDVIMNKKAFVLLDNSKGTGVMESKESLMKKIEHLLSYGMNDIAIFGGFGPDSLDTYFQLRRYYKINFSVDAESKLKTGDKIDLEKTKTYIKQLLRFDDPKQAGLNQTETFLQQVSDEWQEFTIDGKGFRVHPAVFNPNHFPSTKWFKDEMSKIVANHESFCEVGCGAGVISCLLAIEHPRLKIVATDINPFASETTKLNVKNLSLDKQINVFNGDVLDGVESDKKFDSIFWALPFGFLDPGTEIDYRDMQVYDPGYKSTRKFLSEGKKHLNENGALYLGFSEDLGNIDLLEDIARDYNVRLEKIVEHEMQEADIVNFEIIKATYQ